MGSPAKLTTSLSAGGATTAIAAVVAGAATKLLNKPHSITYSRPHTHVLEKGAACCSPGADGLPCKVDHSICSLDCLIDLRQTVKLQAWVLQLGPGTVYVAGEHAHFITLRCQLGSQAAAYEASGTCKRLALVRWQGKEGRVEQSNCRCSVDS
jgi:hypothetical protein